MGDERLRVMSSGVLGGFNGLLRRVAGFEPLQSRTKLCEAAGGSSGTRGRGARKPKLCV